MKEFDLECLNNYFAAQPTAKWSALAKVGLTLLSNIYIVLFKFILIDYFFDKTNFKLKIQPGLFIMTDYLFYISRQ